MANSKTRFKQELKKIAVHYQEISAETKNIMAKFPILISEKKILGGYMNSQDQGPEPSIMSYHLLPAGRVSTTIDESNQLI
jgi:hypothetical protein